MPMNQALLPEFDQEIKNTRECLSRVPDDKFDFKPHQKSGSMGWLANHVSQMTGWLAEMLVTDSFDVAPGGKNVEIPSAKTRAELLAMFDKSSAAARAALAKVTDEQLMKTWTLYQNGATIFAMPRIAVYRGMILNHIIHHRGQLTVYLRLNNIAVPAIYGPSADENPFAAASAG
jgi:uncharacterized damage-inducible protein DinB